jgi:hypothetical protein
MLYFIPAAKSLTKELRAEHGLDSLIDQPQHRETYSGPGGQAGIIVSDRSNVSAERLAYSPDSQTWSPRFGFPSLVGSWTDQAVTPSQLARQNQIAGESLKLLDGHSWIVPKLRAWHMQDTVETLRYSDQLPRRMVQSPITGQFVLGDVIPHYQSIWQQSLEIATSMFAQLSGAESVELDDDEVIAFCIGLLAVNYRVDSSVISHLGLFTPELTGAIIRAGLDWETLRAHLKNVLSRRISGGTNTEFGATPATEA